MYTSQIQSGDGYDGNAFDLLKISTPTPTLPRWERERKESKDYALSQYSYIESDVMWEHAPMKPWQVRARSAVIPMKVSGSAWIRPGISTIWFKDAGEHDEENQLASAVWSDADGLSVEPWF
jgi:hypothetical protein